MAKTVARDTFLEHEYAQEAPFSILHRSAAFRCREEARMADPWMKLEPNGTSQNVERDGARWVLTTGFALALVVLLALLALKAN
ncbi:MAG: hypothetical protein JO094_14630 [Hyphomicrobiales bacterium]|nr:hypothetical protein [Hyphomicrobiales bacterium]